MFRGQSFNTIDAKGRVIVPARFRNVIAETGEPALMLTQLDGGLYAYTLPQWEALEKRILGMERTSKKFRRFRRILIGGSAECRLDKQDRILIPPAMREYAGLEDEIVLSGVLSHFEIWSRARWDEESRLLEDDLNYQREDLNEEDLKEFCDQVSGLGL